MENSIIVIRTTAFNFSHETNGTYSYALNADCGIKITINNKEIPGVARLREYDEEIKIAIDSKEINTVAEIFPLDLSHLEHDYKEALVEAKANNIEIKNELKIISYHEQLNKFGKFENSYNGVEIKYPTKEEFLISNTEILVLKLSYLSYTASVKWDNIVYTGKKHYLKSTTNKAFILSIQFGRELRLTSVENACKSFKKAVDLKEKNKQDEINRKNYKSNQLEETKAKIQKLFPGFKVEGKSETKYHGHNYLPKNSYIENCYTLEGYRISESTDGKWYFGGLGSLSVDKINQILKIVKA